MSCHHHQEQRVLLDIQYPIPLSLKLSFAHFRLASVCKEQIGDKYFILSAWNQGIKQHFM